MLDLSGSSGVTHLPFSFHLTNPRNKKIQPCIRPAFLIRSATPGTKRGTHLSDDQPDKTNTSPIISLALLKCPHFRSSLPELFCKRDVLKNFAKFAGVSSGTRVSCEFCDILKNTFFRRTPEVAAYGICSNRDFLFSYCM